MILLRLISWPYARKHLLRCFLTVLGIVLGVAVFVGMHTANQSVLAAFRQTIDRIAGSTQLQVSAGEPGLDESVLDTQIAVAVLVAVLGIVNALTVSITDRRRELGVLQAEGGLRGQIRHTIWLEALGVGLIGLILGLGLGAVQLYYSVEIARRDLIGIEIAYVYPFRTALALVPTILMAAFLAALGPAERAVRATLVEALEYE